MGENGHEGEKRGVKLDALMHETVPPNVRPERVGYLNSMECRLSSDWIGRPRGGGWVPICGR